LCDFLTVEQMTSQQGIHTGCDASFVLLQARNAVGSIRLRANRSKVGRKGMLVAETPEVVARLKVKERPDVVGFSNQ